MVGGTLVANLPRLPKRENRGTSVSPIKLLGSMSLLQGAFFVSAWLAWTCDAIDFFALSLSVTRLVEQFDRKAHDITTAITLTLLFRPAGALIFGLLTDRYGRKWPFIADLLLCAVFSLCTAFTGHNFGAFLAVRCLFGLAMGGIWGMAAALGLENAPVGARGLLSGLLQQGYAVGYLIAAVINLTAVAKHNDWRVLFYCAAGISLAAALLRLALPESTYFKARQEAAKADGVERISGAQKSKIFIVEAGRAIKLHWIRCVFAVLIMSCFNFFSHGSQDLYPTYIEDGKGLSKHAATVATIIGNCGAIAGGSLAGYISQYLGRRITIIIFCIWAVAFLPLWLIPNTFGPLAAGAFFLQFGVQGAWGVVPVYLSEISPVAFRAVWPGVAYQLGNMVSAASAQIESTAGANIKTADGEPDYGKVSAILIGVVAGCIIFLCLIGSEDHGARFESGKAAFEKGGGRDELDPHSVLPESSDRVSETEKGSVKQEERVVEKV
ncbi:hypothetical protein OIV83_000946 [Microbotryomycetes sp. JL201]|nr:hypothetical protein OIV83_000946 [Microbotryomycetes sp. JL201]